MALTASEPFPIGTAAPEFNLLNTVNNKRESLTRLKGNKGTVILFICNHCPFVHHINEEIVRLAKDYSTKEIGFIAISSNDVVHYPADSPQKMAAVAKKLNYPFAYLYDEDQSVAHAYNAACTPDFYLFDAKLKCTYHGQLDDSRPGNELEVSGSDLRKAIDLLLGDQPPMKEQKASVGCGIKWKK